MIGITELLRNMTTKQTYEKLSELFTNTRIWQIDNYEEEFCFHLICKDFNEDYTRFLKHQTVKINFIDWKNRILWVSIQKEQLEDIGEDAIIELQKELDGENDKAENRPVNH